MRKREPIITKRAITIMMWKPNKIAKDKRARKWSIEIHTHRKNNYFMRIVLSEEKANLYVLATNAGTSVEMLEKFYLRNLPNTSELARNLQSFGENKHQK